MVIARQELGMKWGSPRAANLPVGTGAVAAECWPGQLAQGVLHGGTDDGVPFGTSRGYGEARHQLTA